MSEPKFKSAAQWERIIGIVDLKLPNHITDVQRDVLDVMRQWAKDRAKTEGDSSRMWRQKYPKSQQAHYRAGSANAFQEVVDWCDRNRP